MKCPNCSIGFEEAERQCKACGHALPEVVLDAVREKANRDIKDSKLFLLIAAAFLAGWLAIRLKNIDDREMQVFAATFSAAWLVLGGWGALRYIRGVIALRAHAPYAGQMLLGGMAALFCITAMLCFPFALVLAALYLLTREFGLRYNWDGFAVGAILGMVLSALLFVSMLR